MWTLSEQCNIKVLRYLCKERGTLSMFSDIFFCLNVTLSTVEHKMSLWEIIK